MFDFSDKSESWASDGYASTFNIKAMLPGVWPEPHSFQAFLSYPWMLKIEDPVRTRPLGLKPLQNEITVLLYLFFEKVITTFDILVLVWKTGIQPSTLDITAMFKESKFCETRIMHISL